MMNCKQNEINMFTHNMINYKKDETNILTPMFKINLLTIICCHSIVVLAFTIQNEYKIMDEPVLLSISMY